MFIKIKEEYNGEKLFININNIDFVGCIKHECHYIENKVYHYIEYNGNRIKISEKDYYKLIGE